MPQRQHAARGMASDDRQPHGGVSPQITPGRSNGASALQASVSRCAGAQHGRHRAGFASDGAGRSCPRARRSRRRGRKRSGADGVEEHDDIGGERFEHERAPGRAESSGAGSLSAVKAESDGWCRGSRSSSCLQRRLMRS